MTVIAYRDGAMASDSQITADFTRYGTCKKIGKRTDGSLGGAAGLTSFTQRWMAWFVGGGSEEDMPKPDKTEEGDSDGQCLWVFPSGRIRVVDSSGYYDVAADFFAIGSGSEYALGAMAVGASAEAAVKAAIIMDVNCGGEIQVERLNK